MYISSVGYLGTLPVCHPCPSSVYFPFLTYTLSE
jgi:hypothetical protein